MIQGFSSGLLGNRELIYETDLPSFQRDFASLKTLNHGYGPNISTTSFRGSSATCFDVNGVLQTAANHEPRFDHNPSTGASLGLLIEEARTNSIRNSQAGGSTNGVIGSGGVMPTNWSITPNANGVTSEIIGTGTEDGLAYIDIKVSGTPSGDGNVLIGFDSLTQITASNGQSWTLSAYRRIVGGNATNASVFVNITGRLADGTAISGQTASTTSNPTTAALKTQRTSVSFTFSDATVARVLGRIGIAYTSGAALDLTLRIAAPQLEQGAFATSYIPTTNAAATRAADSAVVTPISSFYNQSEGTFVAQLSYAGAASSVNQNNRVSLQVDNNNTGDRYVINNRQPNGTGGGVVIAGGVDQALLAVGSTAVPQDTAVLLGLAYRVDDIIAAKNGTLSAADTSATLPTVSRFRIGSGFDSANPAAHLNGHIRKIAYWPRRLSNTLLQQLTT